MKKSSLVTKFVLTAAIAMTFMTTVVFASSNSPTRNGTILSYGTWAAALGNSSVAQVVKSYITEVKGPVNVIGIQKNVITDDLFGVTPNAFPIQLGSNVVCSYMDSNKNLWMGTTTELVYYNSTSRTWKEFDKTILGFDKVDMIIPDGKGGVWVLTGNVTIPTDGSNPDYTNTSLVQITAQAIAQKEGKHE